MTVDQILAEIADSPLHLNNLFQTQDGLWQANVRETVLKTEDVEGATKTRATVLHNFGIGHTPAAALLSAIEEAGYVI